MFPEFMGQTIEEKVGGPPSPTSDEIIITDVDGLFTIGLIPPSGTWYQYRKVFLEISDTDNATGVEVYGYNDDDKIVGFAVEKNWDGIVLDGEEVVKNFETEPDTYGAYTWHEEKPSDEAIAVGAVAAGERIGVWLRMRIPSTLTYEANDRFTVGVNFTIGTTVYTRRITFHHTRIVRDAVIYRVEKLYEEERVIGVQINDPTDSNFQVDEGEIYRAIFMDGIFLGEFTGLYSEVQISSWEHPLDITVRHLPHAGYSYAEFFTTPGVRARITFKVKEPSVYDIEKGFIFSDEGTGTFVDDKIGEIDFVRREGGGRWIEKVSAS